MSKEQPDTLQKKWLTHKDKVIQTAKFIKRGTMVLVDPSVLPTETTVEGRFGQRPMYIISTRDYGLIYVTPLQLVNIVESFKGNFKSAMTVEL